MYKSKLKKIKESRYAKGMNYTLEVNPLLKNIKKLSNSFFNKGDMVRGFMDLIKFFSRPVRPRKSDLIRLNDICETLPDKVDGNLAYTILKSIVDVMLTNDQAYRKLFRSLEGRDSVLDTFFAELKDAIFFYQNMGLSVVDALIEDYDVDDDYAGAIANMMDDEDFSLDDIKSILDRDRGGYYVEIGNEEWLFLSDDEADSYIKEEIENNYMTYEFTTERRWERKWEDFIDTYHFDDIMENYNRDYAEEIARENDYEFGNKLVRECYEYMLIDDDDFSKEIEIQTDDEGNDIDVETDIPDYSDCILNEDDLVDRYVNYKNAEDSIEWFIDSFSEEEFQREALNSGALDVDAFITYLSRDVDRGEELAKYDGIEHDSNGIFYYRVN